MCYRMDRTGWHANDYPMIINELTQNIKEEVERTNDS